VDGIPATSTISIHAIPEAGAAATLRLRDALLAILEEDLVAMWLHGGTTFADRSKRPGDLDLALVLASVALEERTPRIWRADSGSRPNRIETAAASIAEGFGEAFDTTYLLLDEVGGRRQPTLAFDRARRETSWAVSRAHWLAGQYVLLHGRPAEELVVPPTASELRHALDRELEHLERHVLEGDASDPYEATYAIWSGARILYTLDTGTPVISKRSAGAWAIDHLPERWHAAIRAAGRSYDGASGASDEELLRVTMGPFVKMIRERLPASSRRAGRRPRWS
jgi:aminoglycoside adenylyltransferase-like protein